MPARGPSAQPGGGSNIKIRDQPHAPEPNLSRAIELAPNRLADYLLSKVVTQVFGEWNLSTLLDHSGRLQERVTIVTQIEPGACGRIGFAAHCAFPQHPIVECGIGAVGVAKVKALGPLRPPC